MRILRGIILCLLLICNVGCSGVRSNSIELMNELSDQKNDIGQAMILVSQANMELENGNFETAQRSYEYLLTTYESKNLSFESAVLTNLAITVLKSGDREKFLHVVNQLQYTSADLNNLSRNTQIVLLLGAEMNGSTNERDLRIHSQLYQAVNQAIY